MSKKKNGRVGARILRESTIRKADTTTYLPKQEAYNSEWLAPELPQAGLRNMVEESSILPQCIRAYKNNIAGFGIGVRYTTDEEETAEMAAEFEKATEIIELLNVEKDTKEIFENIVEAREKYGIAYIEVIRNLAREVVQIEFLNDPSSIRKTVALDPYIEYPYWHHGKEAKFLKRFRKYRQQVGGKTVYFKEFGDPRIMDNRTGEYLQEGETLNRWYHANEILEFSLGTESYGQVRWIGQVLGVDGSRRAEGLNNNYFLNGRHTPLLITIQGGTLTDKAYENLQEYMNEIKGENGQHSFLILEAENGEQTTPLDEEEKPKIEVKDIASILQKDELFQEYLENNRKRVQSAFLLPDLYVGYTTDFNRATAQTAMEVTEEQVFQPERKSLAWVINNKLLNCYHFKYVEAYFLEPDVTNPDDLYKMLNVANNAGGLTPNKAKEVLYKAFGETSEDFEEEWGDIPIKIWEKMNAANNLNMGMSQGQVNRQIEKADRGHDGEEGMEGYLALADESLEERLAEEGFAAAEEAVVYINLIEDGLMDIFNDNTDELLKKIGEAYSVPDFIMGTWQAMKGDTKLPEALEKLFLEQFEKMMHTFTQGWLEKEVPVLAGLDDRITKSGEAFVKEWSPKLAGYMKLTTEKNIEKVLTKAVKKGWGIDRLQAEIEVSGIRKCGWRARRVAVTETLRLESYAQLEAMIQNPLCYKKRWVHTGQQKGEPRTLHVSPPKDGGVNGQEVYKREKFKWGGFEADCPRDKNLPAGESINCHCIMEVIQDENIFGMSDEELKKLRQEMMDEVDAEFESDTK